MFSSPGYCGQCLAPLAEESASGLCPTCEKAAATVDSDRGRPAVVAEPAAPDTVTQHHPGAAPDTATHLPPGRRPLPVAPPGYTIEAELGAGGMGAVYLATDPADRRVAMKFLHAPGNPAAFDRFQVEVRALGRLDHPNIVRVLTVDVIRPDPFFTMEYQAGGALAEWVKHGRRLPATEAATLVRDVARAVGVAHAADILHRDLKPGNILLAPADPARVPEPPPPADGTADPAGGLVSEFRAADFTPKVADFGLARLTDQTVGLTLATGPMGSVPYMAPEQASRGHGDVGPWTDVYGLGATLYHLLTGRPPHDGATHFDIAGRVLEPLARPRSLRPDLPPGLEAIVVRCLEVDPKNRYPSAAAVADDLQRFLDGERQAAPELTRLRRLRRWAGRNRRRLAGAAGAVVAAVGLVIVGWRMNQPGPVTEPPPPPDPVAEMQAELRAGRPVTLIGATGVPRYARARLEPNAVGTSVAAGGAAEFHAFNLCLLELFPDPGVDRYRFEMELKRLRRHVAPAPSETETDYVGLYFGHGSDVAPSGAVAHALFAVTFKDHVPAGRPAGHSDSSAVLRAYNLVERPDGVRVDGSPPFRAVPFTPSTKVPGPWRKVAVEVTPTEVRPLWGPDDREPVPLPTVSANKVGAKYDETRAKLAVLAPGGPGVPGWHPRMPGGVLSFKSAVAVRNVVLTPLPGPNR